MKKRQIAEIVYGITAMSLFLICYNQRITPKVSLAWSMGKTAEGKMQEDRMKNPQDLQQEILISGQVPLSENNDGEEISENPNPAGNQSLPENPNPAGNQSLPENPNPAGNQNLTENPNPAGNQSLTENPNLTGNQNSIENPNPAENENPVLTGNQNLTGEKTERIKIENNAYEQYDNESHAWWFSRKKDHVPSGSGEDGVSIAEYAGYYRDLNCSEEEKIIYLTFDCGYEAGFTPSLLDALKAENVKALFFVTKNFIVRNPALAKRMKEEGHLVGNHTAQHVASTSLTAEELEAELMDVEQAMKDCTGYALDLYFRPPMGEYSARVLKVAQDMGYKNIFWSIAYRDYDADNPPGKEYVVSHFQEYHHNGAIALIHNTCGSNAEALSDVLALLRAEGYRFGTLDELE